ncbi:MAG: trigger factor [Candidatus Omnitrophota bacterium]
MKVEVKKIDATRRELKFQISKDRVSKKLEEIYVDIGKEAKIKGFRPGKAPRHLIESNYSKLAQEETLKKIIPEVYREAVENEKLAPIDLPEIEDVSFKDGTVSFTAKLDIKPDVKIKDYKGIPIQKKSSAVTEEEIAKTFEFFKKGQGKEKELTIDDEFARGLGYVGLDDFKNSLKRQMEVDKDRQNRLDVENQVVEYLLKNAQLSVPQTAVKKQVDYRLSENRRHFEQHGQKKEDIDKKLDEMRKDLEAVSEKDVKVYFILDKIAELENISVTENENAFHKVMGFLLKEAKWEGEK